MPSEIVVGLVEDDPIQTELYSAMLAAGGMRAQTYASAQEFRRRAGVDSIDLLLLDWNLPGMSGIDLLRNLREQSGNRLPIILLTANRDERDIVHGLDSGANDYIVKPPRREELLARIRVACRNVHPTGGPEYADTHPFEFDLRERELKLHGVPVALTEREFDLLAYLFRRTDRIVSRQMLLSDVWTLGPTVKTRSLDTYVSRLRKSLGLNGESGWKLEGVYQHGYRLARVSTTTRMPQHALPSP